MPSYAVLVPVTLKAVTAVTSIELELQEHEQLDEKLSDDEQLDDEQLDESHVVGIVLA